MLLAKVVSAQTRKSVFVYVCVHAHGQIEFLRDSVSVLLCGCFPIPVTSTMNEQGLMRILEYTVVRVLSSGFDSLQFCPHLYDAELTGKGFPNIFDFVPVAGSVKNSCITPSGILWQ